MDVLSPSTSSTKSSTKSRTSVSMAQPFVYTGENMRFGGRRGKKPVVRAERDRGDTDSSLITSFLSVVFYFFHE